MHKVFYASGFLYHPPTEQILLQQNNSISSVSNSWHLFEGEDSEVNNPDDLFKKIILTLLDLEIKKIFPVYSYFNENKKINQSIVYAPISKLKDFPPKNGYTFAWFTFKNVIKMQITPQTKHDIVVGQRVIEAAARKSQGLHTFQ